MSLYNMVMGTDPAVPAILSMLFLWPEDVPPRFRDASIVDFEGEWRICVLTRQGGGNRSDYDKSNRELQEHPLYIRDYDEPSDTTYATFEFRFPEEYLPPDNFIEEVRQNVIRKQTPMQRYMSSIEGFDKDPKLTNLKERLDSLVARSSEPPEEEYKPLSQYEVGSNKN